MFANGSKAEFRRLPSAVTPRHYVITIRPQLKSFTFTGSEVISVGVKEETKQIVLNSLDIVITSATFTTSDAKTLTSVRIESSVETETTCIDFAETLPLGSGELKLEFTGFINDKLKGFYRSKYTAADGQQDRYAAVTHFEATEARRAFPCWDEPALKATFDIRLVVPPGVKALSNMDSLRVKEIADSDLIEIEFMTTPLMSTYLIAYAVGEFDLVEGKTVNGHTVRVYTPVGKKDQGVFALDVAIKSLTYYEDYFDIPYPLSKLDMIAVSDFPIGAMENWGLITYRETCILVDPLNTSTFSKQRTAIIIAHEIAHQWFGNLVTMDWWTDLWLKEGFATFISYLCVNHLFSEYHIWTQFVSDEYLTALNLDALHNSHPIEVPVGHPSEIIEIFDRISYDKGSAVLRMLHRYIGDEYFRKGLHLYLDQHKYGNTVTDDLWTSLQKASDRPVREVMNTWTKQKGYPVITVKSRRDGNSLFLSLSQEKFNADGKADSDVSPLWMIPISVIRSSDPSKAFIERLMDSKSLEIEIPNISADEWIKLNPNSVGIYRVHYSDELLERLLPAVGSKTLEPLDRLGLQSDVFALVQSGLTSAEHILKLLDRFSAEDDYAVWSSIDECLGKFNQLVDSLTFPSIRLSTVVEDIRQTRMGTNQRRDTFGYFIEKFNNQSLIINRLISLEDKRVISESKKLFDSHIKGTFVIPADLKTAVYRAVAIDCDDKTYDSLLKLYRETDLKEERVRVLRGLGSVRDVNRIQQVLDLSISEEVASNDSVIVITSASFSKNGRDIVWQFFKQNADLLKRRYETGVAISSLVKYITENFVTEEKAIELETFFADNPFPGTERTVKQSLEKIRLNSEWLARDLPAIQSFLSNPEFRRLPLAVTPRHYVITIRPQLKSFTFAGSEEISVGVSEQTKQIVLNSLDIDISSATFTTSDAKTLTSVRIESSAKTETTCIDFTETLPLGSGELKLEFTGFINDKLKGFYRSKYTAADGQQDRYAAVTQFAPTDARRAFPCWDEPALKATFDIRLVVPKHLKALSNMDSSAVIPLADSDLTEVQFPTTPRMSTYLIAYAVGEFDFVEGKTVNGHTVRVYTPVGKKDQGVFALDVAIKSLTYYEDYFDIPYPLFKLDMLAVGDFAYGAMENWGLVIYRETYILVDPLNSSALSKQTTATVIAHEIAHQWFGNLVTMDWWTDLWLNEGFATFISYLCINHLFSDYHIWTQYVSETYLAALNLDALHNSHPIEVPVGHPSEINEIFDKISYNKGSAVLRMLHRYIGDEYFRKGLHLYLDQYKYGNTVTEDLWTSLQKASDRPVREVMNTWTKQKGYPVITVKSRRDGNSLILSLSQEKFNADGKADSEVSPLWMIPISVIRSSDQSKAFNSNFRVCIAGYLPILTWPYIAQVIRLLNDLADNGRQPNKTLQPLDRLGLQSDVFALVQSGLTSAEHILKLLDRFSAEDDYAVWSSIDECLGKFNQLVSHTDIHSLFHRFGCQLLSKTYDRLGWEPIKGETHLDTLLRSLIINRLISLEDKRTYDRLGWEPIKGETHLDTLLRSLIINRLISLEDKRVISESKKLFDSHIKGTFVIPADIKTAVYRAVAIDCDDKTYESLLKRSVWMFFSLKLTTLQTPGNLYT
ncbi:unnamed protein product [Medioppia subpectinata]|uniref:Puromycin-sensitive aminopeptidase n=1 Tax=Medioppia subpectinata TaxID=1979941 RepID=A0A7R9KLI4_9ACAR|nr:unnamed protein product [Medioppia subpectinata]CAG2105680.1 unnamed protein product [Medioppia subpectinata]